jgi:hypothetical protein
MKLLGNQYPNFTSAHAWCAASGSLERTVQGCRYFTDIWIGDVVNCHCVETSPSRDDDSRSAGQETRPCTVPFVYAHTTETYSGPDKPRQHQHSVSFKPISILSSHLQPCLPSYLLPSRTVTSTSLNSLKT